MVRRAVRLGNGASVEGGYYCCLDDAAAAVVVADGGGDLEGWCALAGDAGAAVDAAAGANIGGDGGETGIDGRLRGLD